MSAPAVYRHPFLPDFCEQGNLLRTMLIAQLLAFILVAATPGDWFERLRSLATISLFIQWVAVIDIALLCGLQARLARLDDRVAAFLAFALLQSVTLVFTIVAHVIAGVIALPVGRASLEVLLLENGTISVIVTAIILRYFYVTAQWRREVEASADARVQALQARIRPHFLFNCMNTIASLTRSDAATAESAVEDLSELFRASLAQKNVVALSEELELAASYLRLERQRLGDRLQVEWALDPSADDIEIPALTLQPLVENAVYHGVEQCDAGGAVRIETRASDDAVGVTVSNPVPAVQRQSGGHRIAQDNVRQRLELAYHGRARMDVTTPGDTYCVTLTIPRNGRAAP